MCLIQIVIWILTQNHGLHIRQRSVARPAVHVFAGREDFLSRQCFIAQEAFEAEEGLACDFILQRAEPTLVKSFDFEFEELFLLVGEFGEPGFFVEGRRLRCRCGRGGGGLGRVDGAIGRAFGLAEEGGAVLRSAYHAIGNDATERRDWTYMLPSPLGFFAVVVAASTALRLSDMARVLALCVKGNREARYLTLPMLRLIRTPRGQADGRPGGRRAARDALDDVTASSFDRRDGGPVL